MSLSRAQLPPGLNLHAEIPGIIRRLVFKRFTIFESFKYEANA